MTPRGPSQQAEGGDLAPGSYCCPPATVAGPTQGVLIPGGKDSQNNHSHGLESGSRTIPNVVGVGEA